jgi:predicted secreted protein
MLHTVHIDRNITQHAERLAVRAGDQIEITVGDNPSTGYQWQVDFDEGRVRTVSDIALGSERYDHVPDSGHLIGGPVARRIVFEVQRPDTAIRLVRRRPWESESPPIATADITLAAA